MKKRSIRLLFVVAVTCAILWTALSGSKPAEDQPAAKTTGEDQTGPKGDSKGQESAEPEAVIGRESPRHAAGDLEKHRRENSLTALNKAVLEQEAKVEERRKVLSTIVRTKGIIYRSGETSVSNIAADAPENLARAEYADAKRDFEADQELLQEMKLKQIGETIKAKNGGN